MLDRADCADFGCHNSIRLETKHFLNTLALTFISFSGRFVFAMQKHYLFFCERSSSCYSKGSETDGITQACKDPPVPGQLVSESQIPPSLSPAYSRISRNLSEVRSAGELGEIRPGPQTSLQLHRLRVRAELWPSQVHTGLVDDPATKNTGTTHLTGLSSPAVHVLDSCGNSHRETSSPQQTLHETHTVASYKQLEGTRAPRKGHTHSKVTPPAHQMVAPRSNILQGQPLHPLKHALQIFTDTPKEG